MPARTGSRTRLRNAGLLRRTPAAIQRAHVLTRRRYIFAGLNAITYGLLLLWLGSILQAGGWSGFDIAIMICFAAAAPWGVLGIWNALIGLWLLHRRQDGRRNWLRQVAPYAAAGETKVPITARTAVVMTICNESPQRAFARLETVRQSLERTSAPDAYDYFVLSDTANPEIAEQEQAAFDAWREAAGENARLHYRRRDDNAGYKAGNLRDFCERWGAGYDFFLPLDADSLMSGETIERMVRICQAWPRIGILQSLAVGTPSQSAFARIFQFGMRHGMRPYTIGSAWWNGDCGPFWGHNALVRTAPFHAHCHLPELPENAVMGGRILSHDQVEAVLMRKAGYEVRVLPLEGGSWEDNPPHVLEFMQRDTRWCQGNLQYVHLLNMRGIQPTSRFQLIWAVMMFAGLPAWTAIIALAALKPLDGETLGGVTAVSAIAFYIFFLLMFLAPKLAGYADIALTRGELSRYGGAMRFAFGAVVEVIFSFLTAAIVSFRTSAFMMGLLFGKRIGWGAQKRDAHAVGFADAFTALWPQLLFGLGIYAAALTFAPALALWSLPLTLGYVAGIPFAMAGASPMIGLWAQKRNICAIPEDLHP
ncbi:MAG: glucans biosynthesis glucosyltransferase MdoH, partial [Hyphomicrobiales bacterium]|nr:glucans biosynthesis glucosyltransferase MdoH [Hyphomicrobiales bacterium]